MKIRFFLPESDDLVDPGFDFTLDAYSPSREDVNSDVYAHEIFPKPNFDGLLVTKSNISKKLEKIILEKGGIHDFLCLAKKYPIMGDCGAFQFIQDSKPPYTCKEIYSYYEKLGFDFGITLDHVIPDFDLKYDAGKSLFPSEPTDDMKFRYRLTLDNAKEMLVLAKKRKASVKLIGSVQGWSPKSYHEGVKELIRCGFDYIALGGVARAPNEAIVPILREVRATIKRAGAKLHILGVARLNILNEYLKTNVASCDSATSIMQAFKSGKENYHMPEKTYTAIRIPAVNGDMSPKVRKLLAQLEGRLGQEGLAKEKAKLAGLETEALEAVRLYARRKISLGNTMKALIKYEDQLGGEKKYYSLFENTLHDRPWEKCPCAICKELGVEVVILRGNNRNRRRGFHNTYVFYQRFKKAVGRA